MQSIDKTTLNVMVGVNTPTGTCEYPDRHIVARNFISNIGSVATTIRP